MPSLPSLIPPWKIPAKGPPPLSPRERVLADWRGVDALARQKSSALNARSSRDVMSNVLNRLGLDRKRTESEIVRAWEHLVDPRVTAHAQPAGLVRGTLFVTVDSSVWLDEIVRYRRREILERLQHAFGRQMIQRVSFRVG